MTIDELISTVTELGAKQHGLVSVAQVPKAERRRLRHLAVRGVLTHEAKGVYRVSGAPVSWEQRLTARAWALGDKAVVSHRSAARLHGFDRFTGDQIEFLVHRVHRGREVGGAKLYSTGELPRGGEVVQIDGLTATCPDRTIVDLGRIGVSAELLGAAIDSAIRLHLTTLDRLLDRVGAQAGAARRGLSRLDEALLDSGGESTLERAFLGLVRRAGIPRPKTQAVHRREGHHVARVDFLFEGTGVVVEVSGGRGHSTPSDRARDASRRNELQQMGRVVLEFTYEQVTKHEPMVIETLERSLDRRG